VSSFEFENLILKHGLVQFGHFFDSDHTFVPFKINLNWMVSYPDVLRAAAFNVQDHFSRRGESIKQFERILCPFDTLPVATLVSDATGIPIVYSRNRGESVIEDLVGAYDINHPTLLLSNSNITETNLGELCRHAYRVGLHVNFELVLVESYSDKADVWYEESHKSGMVTGVTILAQRAQERLLITESQKNLVNAWFAGRK